ncbi:MAG: ABC transporter ATP-binding protein [Bacteroidia bacterium]
MKAVFQFLRYAAKHKGLIFYNFFFNLLYIVFHLISLLLIMPVLRYLFASGQPESPSISVTAGAWFQAQYQSFLAWFSQMAAGEPYQALAYLAGGLVAVTLLKNASRFLAMNFMVLIRNRSVQGMRVGVYEQCLNLPLGFYTNERKGDLLSRMSNDMKEIEFALMVSLEALYFMPLNILLFLGALLILSAKLTGYILLFLPLTAGIVGLIGRSLRKKSQRNQALLGTVMSSFEETLGGIRIIKAFSSSAFFLKRYQEQDEAYTRNNIGVQRRYDLSSPLSETIGISVSALLLWLGGSMVFKGELSPELFLTYFAIFAQLIPPFKGFSNALYAAQKGMASLERIQELVQAKPVPGPRETGQKPNFQSRLEFRSMGFAYAEGKEVLSGIDLSLQKGQTLALVGPSGAGKTTLTDVLAGFYQPTSGEILLDGQPASSWNENDWRLMLAMVSQESILFNDSVRNNVALGRPDIPEDELIAALKAAHAWDFVSAMPGALDANIGERGSRLSGGQRQRLAIARALLRNPDLLILDEATSALDSQSEKAVQLALNELMKNRTSVVIAHRLSTVQHADCIAVMDQGKIVELGTHSELMAKQGLYYNLIQLQQLG